MGSFYYSGMDLEYLKDSKKWVKVGYLSNYSKVIEEVDIKSYDFLLKLKTPFEQLEDIDFHTKLEMEESVYRGNVSTRTPGTLISLAGAFEVC